MKKFISGLLTGLIITVSITTFANSKFTLTKSPFPINVNGIKFKSELPILNYQGNTYVPLRAVGDLLGTEVDFKDNVIEIGETTLTTDGLNGEKVKINNSTDYGVFYKKDGIRFTEYKNKKYINGLDYYNKVLTPMHNDKYTFDYNYQNNTIDFISKDTKQTLVKNVPFIEIENNLIQYLDYDFVQKNILPILER